MSYVSKGELFVASGFMPPSWEVFGIDWCSFIFWVPLPMNIFTGVVNNHKSYHDYRHTMCKHWIMSHLKYLKIITTITTSDNPPPPKLKMMFHSIPFHTILMEIVHSEIAFHATHNKCFKLMSTCIYRSDAHTPLKHLLDSIYKETQNLSSHNDGILIFFEGVISYNFSTCNKKFWTRAKFC